MVWRLSLFRIDPKCLVTKDLNWQNSVFLRQYGYTSMIFKKNKFLFNFYRLSVLTMLTDSTDSQHRTPIPLHKSLGYGLEH